MKSLINSVLAIPLMFFAFQSNAEVISAVKAAELACHRVDRLVVLKKIDKSYLSKFQKLVLTELPANSASGGKFSVTTYQTAPTSGSAHSLTVVLDETGKVLSHQLNEGGAVGPDVAWTGKDPVSLAEAGLHFVLDEQLRNEQLRPFAGDFQSLILSQKSINGSTVAEMVMKSYTTTAKLVLIMDLNGKLLNKQVIP